jgi:hypothetical protein
MTLLDFFASIAASLIAGVVLIAVSPVVFRSVRVLLTQLAGRVLRTDVDYVFNDLKDVSEDMVTEITQAASVSIMTSRGKDLHHSGHLRECLDAFIRRPTRDQPLIRVLLPEPGSTWTQDRQKEGESHDVVFPADQLARDIEATVAYVCAMESKSKAELRIANMPHMCRIVLTDRCVYFTMYRSDLPGSKTRVAKYFAHADTYRWLKRLFEQYWSVGRRPCTQVSNEPGKSKGAA